MAFLRLKTSHGFSMGDAYSAFQKYLRRGDIDYALYWGAQIGRSVGDIKGYPNALKKRLLQHVLEDIGHLPYALRLLNSIKTPTWEELVQWIVLFCQLHKTRAAAWINRVAVEYITNPRCAPSKILKLVAETLILHRDRKIKELEEIYGKDIMKLYKFINNEVLVFHTYLLIKNCIIVPDKMVLMLPNVPDVDLDTLREIPDWVFDKHTIKGKALGRGYTHFLETMIVNPRMFDTEDPFEIEARNLYTNGKEQRVRHILMQSTQIPTPPILRKRPEIVNDEPALVPTILKNNFKCFLQAQPITGRTKPRTWFATNKITGKQVVIKGPMESNDINNCIKSELIKKILNLPNTNIRILEDDISYIIQDSLVDYTILPTHIISTKLETDICVPENLSVPGWNHDMVDNTDLAYKILEGLLFRKVVGTNDTCTRNFIVIDNIIYSIDDASLDIDTDYMWKIPLIKPLKKYQNVLDICWDKLVETISIWRTKLIGNVFALKQLDKYSNLENWKWA